MKICICTTPIRPNPTPFPPFGSMAIIQALRNIGEAASFYHIDYHRYKHSQISEYFASQQFDMVGISAVVSTAYAYTKYLIQLIKNVSPKTIVFVGGNLAASAEVLHRKAKADYCVIGDGEIIAQNLVKACREKKTSDDELKKILGITFLDSKNKFTFTGYDHPLPADMLERPDYSILEEDNSINYYIAESRSAKGEKRATVIVAKGCVAKCTFCHRFEKGYRVSPVDSIINHMKMLKEKYNVTFIEIGDENFGSDKKETIKLIKGMKSLGLKWCSNGVRVHTIKLEDLKLWKECGCVAVAYGNETGSPTMLKVMEKKVTLEQNIQALKDTYDAGLDNAIQLVVGMPGETDKTIDETIDYLIKTMPYYPDSLRKNVTYEISINYAQALPGTPLYEYAREHGFVGKKDVESEEAYLLKISDKDAYDSDHFINYTQQPLLKALTWRPKILWKLFREHAKTNLNISLSKLSILLSLLIISINYIFNLKLNSPLKKTIDKIDADNPKPAFQNFNNYFYFQMGLKLLLPWNKFTYPLIAVFVAFKEARGLARYIRGTLKKDPRKRTRSGIKYFFKLIFDHILWSLNVFKKFNLPGETLRKIVKIEDTDGSLKIRQGR